MGPHPVFGSADGPLMVATNDPSVTSNGIDRPMDQHDARDDDEMSVPPHSTQAEEAVLGAVLKRGLACGAAQARTARPLATPHARATSLPAPFFTKNPCHAAWQSKFAARPVFHKNLVLLW
jgi:hypothetical protein